jgi:hypothetical protein
MQPDVVFALTDTPLTPPPYSQKRITKSIERSAAWVADMLRPLPGDADSSEPHTPRLSRHPLNVFVYMAGGMSLPAREAFAYGLRETLHGPEADAVKPLRCLDEGISGYAFDLAVLRGIKPSPNTSQHQSLPDGFLRLNCPEMLQHPEPIVEAPTPSTTASSVLPMAAEPSVPPNPVSLLKASLGELSEQKPRLVTGIRSPHEMLRLIRDVGVDLFDVGWATNAANLGVALDFVFRRLRATQWMHARVWGTTCTVPSTHTSLGVSQIRSSVQEKVWMESRRSAMSAHVSRAHPARRLRTFFIAPSISSRMPPLMGKRSCSMRNRTVGHTSITSFTRTKCPRTHSS